MVSSGGDVGLQPWAPDCTQRAHRVFNKRELSVICHFKNHGEGYRFTSQYYL